MTKSFHDYARITGNSEGWVEIESMNNQRHGHDSAVSSSHIYATCGDDGSGGLGGQTSVEKLNTDTDSWSSFTSHPNPPKAHSAWYFNSLYTGPGDYGNDGESYTYKEENGSWTRMNDAPTERDGVKGEIINDIAYVIAGERYNQDSSNRNVNEGYNASSESWSSYATIPTPVRDYASAALNGNVYIIGGVDAPGDSGQTIDTVQVYDVSSDSWSTVADYPDPVFGASATSDGTSIYASGGNLNGSTTDRVFKYNPNTNTWTEIESMITARISHAMEYHNNALYAFGGRNSNGSTLSSAEKRM